MRTGLPVVRRLPDRVKVLGKRFTDPGGQRHQQAIGGACHSVLLVNDHRNTGQLGGNAPGAGHIATKTDDTDRPQPADDPRACQPT